MSTSIGKSPDPVDREIEQLERRGVGPMHILADNQHGLLPRQTLKLVEKGGERLSPLLHWIQAERRIALAGCDRKKRGDQRRRVGHLLRSKRQHCLKLVELLLGRVLRPDAGGALELSDKGMKRTVGVVRRALIPHPAVRPQRRTLAERCDQARFSDPGLAGNQHRLALALPRQLLAREREFDLCLAADKAHRARGAHRLEAALRCGSTFDRPDRDGFGDALDLADGRGYEK